MSSIRISALATKFTGTISCDGYVSGSTTGVVRQTSDRYPWGWAGNTSGAAVHPYIATFDTAYESEIFISPEDTVRPASLACLLILKY